MSSYPVTLQLAGRRCVVVGGGAVGARRAAFLAEAGAHVVVVAPEVDEGVRAAEVHRRAFVPPDLDGAFLVISATDAAGVNAEVAAAARARGVLVNIADDPGGSDFHAPAVLRRGALTVAVSTGGASPELARRLRDKLGGSFGSEHGELCELLSELRDLVREKIADPIRRREILRAAGDPDLAHLIEREGRQEAWRRLTGLLDAGE